MNTLRFITAGNVDDGKSTLIGRLLYDSDSIHTDQLGVLQKQTKQEGVDIDLSLITDGLRAEREQGITIDVAYKYFSTSKRKFIIADAPGHEQYTRNMITGASNSDLIIVLVDARNGITDQTKRHASVGSLMGIKKAIIAINKIDLLNTEIPEQSENILHISAKNDIGMDLLLEKINDHIFKDYIKTAFLIPYDKGEIISYFNESTNVLDISYEENGTKITVECHQNDFNRYKIYAVEI